MVITGSVGKTSLELGKVTTSDFEGKNLRSPPRGTGKKLKDDLKAAGYKIVKDRNGDLHLRKNATSTKPYLFVKANGIITASMLTGTDLTAMFEAYIGQKVDSYEQKLPEGYNLGAKVSHQRTNLVKRHAMFASYPDAHLGIGYFRRNADVTGQNPSAIRWPTPYKPIKAWTPALTDATSKLTKKWIEDTKNAIL